MKIGLVYSWKNQAQVFQEQRTEGVILCSDRGSTERQVDHTEEFQDLGHSPNIIRAIKSRTGRKGLLEYAGEDETYVQRVMERVNVGKRQLGRP